MVMEPLLHFSQSSEPSAGTKGGGGDVRGMCCESCHYGIFRTARWMVAKGVALSQLEQEGENGRWSWGSREPPAQRHSQPQWNPVQM